MGNTCGVELVGRTYLSGDAAVAIYGVETRDRGTVFMSIRKSNYYNDRRSVVIVDASRFLAAWRNGYGPSWLGSIHGFIDPIRRKLNPHAFGRDKWLPYLSREAWLNDYKFSKAVRGFEWGIENPVPLAEVGFATSDDDMECIVDFTNGITRTLYLLAYGAKAFPVEVSTSIADGMWNSIGAQGADKPVTVEALLADITWEKWIEMNINASKQQRINK